MISTTEKYKELRKQLIHPWERPMRFINIVIFFVTLIASVGFLLYIAVTPEAFGEKTQEYLSTGFSIFALIGVVIYTLGMHYAKARAYSVKITEKQFPEVYNIIKEYSEKLEMGYVPEAFIVQRGGAINAFAASFFAKRFISINSDVFEVSYLEHKDMDTLSLIIGHELGHLKRKHATTLMTILETPSRLIPLWSSACSRVKEYTCDRHAAWLCPDGVDGIMLLAVGKHLYKEIDIDEYIETSNKHYKGLFCWLVNLNASHPVMPKRVKAIKNLDKRGKVF